MKKIFSLLLLLTGMIFNGYGQEKGYPNPAATYIQKMGYNLETRIDARGNQYTVCIFPDGTTADAWAFITGKAGKEFSYCARQGYSIETQTINHDTWTEEMAVCTKTNKSGQKESIPMIELMEKNGEPLIGKEDQVKPETEGNYESAKTDPRLKDAAASSLPGKFDWTNTPAGYPYESDPAGLSYIGGIRDQGTCGSCYAFGACDNSEGVYNVANHLYNSPTTNNCVDFSESFIMWCLGRLPQYSSHFSGCKGADYSYSELEAQVTDGIISEKNFPYTPKDPGSCTHWNDSPRYSFSNWYRVPCNDTESIKRAIYNYGVIDAAVDAVSAFVTYKSGIYKDNNTNCVGTNCWATPVDHAIGLVGWGGASNARYFILRNSWGPSWGMSGYMYIDMFSAHVACEAGYLTLDPISCTEITGNNSCGAATTISTNTEIHGKLSTENSDYYKFSTVKGGTYLEAQLYTLPSNYDLTLYDANCKVLATSTKSGNQPEKIIYNTKSTGTYFVSVTLGTGGTQSSNCYTLLVSAASSGWSLPGNKEEIVNDNSGSTLNVYPNPTTGKLNLDYNGAAAGKVVINVYSITGQKVLNQEFEAVEGFNTYSIDLGTNSRGIYFLELMDQNGRITKKISLE